MGRSISSSGAFKLGLRSEELRVESRNFGLELPVIDEVASTAARNPVWRVFASPAFAAESSELKAPGRARVQFRT